MVSERLKLLREKSGFTKKQVSHVLKMTPEGYGYYESGHRSPSPETISTLAEYYGVTTDYIHGLSDTPTSRSEDIDNKELNIPSELQGKLVAFNRGEFEGLDQDEVDKLAEYSAFLKSQRKG